MGIEDCREPNPITLRTPPPKQVVKVRDQVREHLFSEKFVVTKSVKVTSQCRFHVDVLFIFDQVNKELHEVQTNPIRCE